MILVLCENSFCFFKNYKFPSCEPQAVSCPLRRNIVPPYTTPHNTLHNPTQHPTQPYTTLHNPTQHPTSRPTQHLLPSPTDHRRHVIEREALVAPYGAPLIVVLPGSQDEHPPLGTGIKPLPSRLCQVSEAILLQQYQRIASLKGCPHHRLLPFRDGGRH